MANDLLLQLATLTDLPTDMMYKELNSLMSDKGLQAHEVTLDTIREVLAEYLQDIIMEQTDTDPRVAN